VKYVSDKSCIENQKTHFLLNIFSSYRAVKEITWKNVIRARQATDEDMILRRKDVLCMPDN